MYILARTLKNGQPMDEASAKIIKKLKEYATQQPKTSQHGAARDDIFSQVVGEDRRGLVRTYGLGPSSSDLWGGCGKTILSLPKKLSQNNITIHYIHTKNFRH